MKDEELAKEYEEKAEYIEVNDYGKKRYDSIDIQQAFLAGLKAGRPQWHDLRKDPTDLPKESVFEWVSERVIGVSEIATNQFLSRECQYDFVEKIWKTYEDPYVAEVIAWCEIPIFDKE